MTTLTFNEGVVIDVLRLQGRLGDPVAVDTIRRAALDYGVKYDQVHRALNGLVAKGLAEKPSRGYYLPTADYFGVT